MSECGRPDCYITDLHTHQTGTDGIIGQVCEHGSLKRQCYICELESQFAASQKEAQRYKRALGSILMGRGECEKRMCADVAELALQNPKEGA